MEEVEPLDLRLHSKRLVQVSLLAYRADLAIQSLFRTRLE
jgi:hypothetical protein